MDTKANLRQAYRKTWEAFSRQTTLVHKLAASADKTALEAAMRQADQALVAHKEARDRLVAAMIPGLPARHAWTTCHARPATQAAKTAL